MAFLFSNSAKWVGCGEGVPLPAGGGNWIGAVPLSPENFEFFDLQMVCFGVFCGAKFNIFVTTKSCKNHTWGTTADATKRNKHVVIFSNFANKH